MDSPSITLFISSFSAVLFNALEHIQCSGLVGVVVMMDALLDGREVRCIDLTGVCICARSCMCECVYVHACMCAVLCAV